jgi:hypothetical protein
MNALDAVLDRLHHIAATASLAARALDGASVDWLPPELERFAMQLEGVAARLVDVRERLSVGVDPQRGPTAAPPVAALGEQKRPAPSPASAGQG